MPCFAFQEILAEIKLTKTPLAMKRLLLLACAAVCGLLFFQGKPTENPAPAPYLNAELPAEVKAVVDQKCYGCHNVNSKNEKGKAKLDWDALTKMKKAKRVATMDEINEVLTEGEMPPKKFLENKPEGALTEAELATLLAWSSGKKKK